MFHLTWDPLVSIWSEPRKTIRKTVKKKNAWIDLNGIIILSGIAGALSSAYQRNMGDSLSFMSLLFSAIFVGAFFGIVGLFVQALLLQWSSKLLGGKGKRDQLMTVVALSSTPLAWQIPIWILLIALFGDQLFMASLVGLITSDLTLNLILLGSFVIMLALSIWSWVLLVIGISEVEHFPKTRSFMMTLLSLLIFFGIIAMGIVVLGGLATIR